MEKYKTPQAVTMLDVAKACKITPSTVSRALNKPEKVKQETRDRIEAAMQELGYTANPWASSLKTNKFNLVGVAFISLDETLYNDTLVSIEHMASLHGLDVLFAYSGFEPEKEESVFRRFRACRVSQLICLGASTNTDNFLNRHLPHIPKLFLWETTDSPHISSMGVDYERCALEATEYLYKLGHTRIGLVRAARSSQNSKRGAERMRGFNAGLTSAHLPLEPGLIAAPEHIIPGQTVSTSKAATLELLSQKTPPTALLTSTSYLALGALSAATAMGLRVPEDLSLLCLNEDRLLEHYTPPISSIGPQPDLAQSETERCLHSFFSETSIFHVTLPTSIIARQSCQAPRLGN